MMGSRLDTGLFKISPNTFVAYKQANNFKEIPSYECQKANEPSFTYVNSALTFFAFKFSRTKVVSPIIEKTYPDIKFTEPFQTSGGHSIIADAYEMPYTSWFLLCWWEKLGDAHEIMANTTGLKHQFAFSWRSLIHNNLRDRGPFHDLRAVNGNPTRLLLADIIFQHSFQSRALFDRVLIGRKAAIFENNYHGIVPVDARPGDLVFGYKMNKSPAIFTETSSRVGPGGECSRLHIRR